MTESIFGCPYDVEDKQVIIFNPFFEEDGRNDWNTVVLQPTDTVNFTRINRTKRPLPELIWTGKKFKINASCPPVIIAHKIKGVLHLVK